MNSDTESGADGKGFKCGYPFTLIPTVNRLTGERFLRHSPMLRLLIVNSSTFPIEHGDAITHGRNPRRDAAHDHLQLVLVPLRESLDFAQRFATHSITRSPRILFAA